MQWEGSVCGLRQLTMSSFPSTHHIHAVPVPSEVWIICNIHPWLSVYPLGAVQCWMNIFFFHLSDIILWFMTSYNFLVDCFRLFYVFLKVYLTCEGFQLLSFLSASWLFGSLFSMSFLFFIIINFCIEVLEHIQIIKLGCWFHLPFETRSHSVVQVGLKS